MSPLDWANSRRTFDGAAVGISSPRWRATGFWTRPVRGRKHRLNGRVPGSEFFGIYVNLGREAARLTGDLYWLALDQDRAVEVNGTVGEARRHTVGGRLSGEPWAAWTFDLEAALQVGEIGGERLRSGMASLVVRFTPEEIPGRPTLLVGADWARGDRDAGGRVGTFDQLFPLGHAYLGSADLVGRKNIVALQAGLQLAPAPSLRLALRVHTFWRESRDDALYTASGAVFVPGSASRASHIGTELDLAVRWDWTPRLRVSAGYSRVIAGAFLRRSTPGHSMDFAYLQTRWIF